MVPVMAPFSFTLVERETQLGFKSFLLVTGTIWGLLGEFPVAWYTVRGDSVLPVGRRDTAVAAQWLRTCAPESRGVGSTLASVASF